MINLRISIILSVVFFIFCSCDKEQNIDFDVDLPENVAMNDAVIFFNGVQTEDYSERRVYDIEVNGIMSYGFSNPQPEVGGGIAFAFDMCSRSIGYFEVIDDTNEAFNNESLCYASMSQVVDEDLRGQSFELHNDGDNYLEITELDFENKFARGHFRVKFKRTGSGEANIGDTELPRWVTFHGVFAQEFEEW